MRTLLLLLVLVLSVVVSACSQNLNRVDSAAYKYAQGDFHAAFRDAYIAARAGDPQAQYALGYFYYYGKGVIANDVEAKRWFRQAALKGHPDAKRALKVMQTVTH